MAPSLLVLLLGSIMILLHCSTVYCQELLGLPPANMIESLVTTYQEHLSLKFNQQRLFPFLKFNFSGRIIGWKFAASDHVGGIRAILSVWSPNNLEYIISDKHMLYQCFSSEITINNGRTVLIHESGPAAPGIEFNVGDILGIFMRPEDVANYVVYLYDGNQQSAISAMNDYFSYSIDERTPYETKVILSNIDDRDQLLPLLSLHLCTRDSSSNHIPACNGTTMQKSSEECERMLPTDKTITSNIDSPAETTLIPNKTLTTSYNPSSPSDITLPTFPVTFLIIAAAVPGILVFIIFLVCVLLVATCCMLTSMKKHSKAATAVTEEVITSASIAYHCSSLEEQDNVDSTLVQSATDNTVANSYSTWQEASDYEEPVHSNNGNRNEAVAVVDHVYDSASQPRSTHAALPDKKIPLRSAPLYEEMGLSSPIVESPVHVYTS